MAASKPTPDTGPNWAIVGLGTLLLVLVVAAVPDIVLRAIAAAIIMGGTFYLAQSREEPQIENPLLDQLRTHKTEGLDRRKYGRLRSRTDRLLEQVRQMNRIAIQGREGKLAPRHAHAELDRIAALMRDTVDEIRKSAGVPTPIEEASARGSKAQPQVVLPKASREEAAAEEAAASTLREAAAEGEEPDEADRMLDELEAQAEAESKKAGELKDSSAEEEEEEEPEEAEEESEEDEGEREEDEEESAEEEDDPEKTR